MSAWLKSIGEAGNPIPVNWFIGNRNDALTHAQFSRRPSVDVGDLLVLYAAGRRCVCGIVQVISSPVEGESPDNWTDEQRSRWGWSVQVVARLVIAADDHAPTLDAIEVDPLSVRRQSHIRLTQRQFALAAQAIMEAELNSLDAAKVEMHPRAASGPR